MKKLFYISIIALLGSVVVSCDMSMEENVYSSITQQSYNYTEEDFDPIVAAAYTPLRDFSSAWNYLGLQENTTDEMVMPPNASGWDDAGIYRILHYQTWNSEHSIISSLWSTLYKGVLLCNNAISQIENDEIPATEAKKEAGLLELRAVRAYYYWLICDNFGDAPLVIDTEFALPSASPREDIYAYVESELLEVAPQLANALGGDYYGRMTQWAAYCTLANLYLNAEVYTGTAQWAACEAICDKIIASPLLGLTSDYNASFRAQGVETCNEIIFSIPYDEDYASGQNIYLFSWHGSMKDVAQTVYSPWGAGCMMGISQFIDTYDEDDTRLEDTWLMGEQLLPDGTPALCTYDLAGEPLVFTKDIPNAQYTKESEGYRMFKYEIEVGGQYTSNTDYPIFRYAEVLLMKAECLLRQGKSGAGALVTEVRERAFKDNPSKAIVSDSDLAEDSCYNYGYVENYTVSVADNTGAVKYGRMYDELGWEFAWESHRRRDMIRFGTYTTKSYLSHEPQGSKTTMFPIPESVLTSNPNLVQNPNY